MLLNEIGQRAFEIQDPIKSVCKKAIRSDSRAGVHEADRSGGVIGFTRIHRPGIRTAGSLKRLEKVEWRGTEAANRGRL